MLPTQILLNNLLYDLSEVGIPFDRVAPSATARPQVWDMAAVLRFAGVMGPLSSLFDLLTFGALLLVFGAPPEEFRTAWFLESMATQILVIFVIRTSGRPWRNSARPILAAISLSALAVALAAALGPLAGALGFAPMPGALLGAIGLLVVLYLAAAERLKRVAVR